MSESKVQVAVRIRPLLGKEKIERCTPCVDVLSERELLMGGDKQFTFDYVFGMDSGQEDVYDKAVAPLVENLFEGYNATVLAYGQTGSGKTFTMGSGCAAQDSSIPLNGNDVGVIPRATKHIFETIAEKRTANPNIEFYLRIQFLELYGEILRDLLDPVGTAQGKQVTIRDGPNDSLQIVGALEETAKGPEDMLAVLEKGTLCRTTGSTHMNHHSSRSHAIFTIVLEQQIRPAANLDGKEEEIEYRTAKFHFVDLAGSERAKRTGATGQRMREGININKGLLALGNVISALGSEEAASGVHQHVRYRDSRLTRMLQDSLGGNSRTLMIACISPADVNFEETLNALRYANRARNIKNRAVVNRDPASSQIAALKAQIAQLKSLIANGDPLPPGMLTEAEDETMSRKSAQLSASSADFKKRCRMLEEEVARLAQSLEFEKRNRLELETRFERLQAERIAFLAGSDESTVEGEESDDEEGNEKNNSNEIDELETSLKLIEPVEAVVNEPDKGEDEEDESASQIKHRFAKSQRALRKLFSKFDETLRSKEEAMQVIVEERQKYEALKAHFESKMAEMNEEVRETQTQREVLEQKLRDLESQHQQTDASRAEASKLRSLLQDKDRRLKELEDRTRQLHEARKAAAEWQRKEAQVRSDIEGVKREKVELQRKMSENHKRHAEMLKERQLEIAGLKRERARLEQDTNQLAAKTERDSKLIQQKSEQIAAMQRKLREAQKLTSHPKALSERERQQRKELERLAALQVKKEEELADLRRALAKKEEAITRRNHLVEQLEKMKNAAPLPTLHEESLNIAELVPEATQEDMKELEQHLEAVDCEIMFRDRQCREVLQKSQNPHAVATQVPDHAEDSDSPLVLTFSSLEQAKDVCRVLMQMFVESKRELRERRIEVDRFKVQVLHQDQAAKFERRRTETLLHGVSSPRMAMSSSGNNVDIVEDEQEDEVTGIATEQHIQGSESQPPPSTPMRQASETQQNNSLVASEARIRKMEAKLRLFRVDEVKESSRNPGGVPVWDRLTSPSAATGIHKYRIRRSMATAQSYPIEADEECIDEIIKVPRRVSAGSKQPVKPVGLHPSIQTVGPNDDASDRTISQVEAIFATSPTQISPEKAAPKQPAGWERVATQFTESYNNKRLLDMEARRGSLAGGVARARPSSPTRRAPPVPVGLQASGTGKENSTRLSTAPGMQQGGAFHISASDLRKMRKDHFASERLRRRKQTEGGALASPTVVTVSAGEESVVSGDN